MPAVQQRAGPRQGKGVAVSRRVIASLTAVLLAVAWGLCLLLTLAFILYRLY